MVAGQSYNMEPIDNSRVREGSILRDIWKVKRTLLVIILPIALLPLPILSQAKETRCAYGLGLMAMFWITESLPLAVTSLMPMIVFPFFEVMKASDVAANYIKETTMFGFGGLTVAIAVESCGLHKRIALRTLTLVGSEARWLMLGFMLPTWFLSMWISNTATTAMMTPIISAVIDELRRINHMSEVMQQKRTKIQNGTSNNDYVADVKEVDLKEGGTEIKVEVQEDPEPDDGEVFDASDRSKDGPEFVRLCKGFSLCVAYAANIGGTGSMSGTSPNIIMQGQAEILFQTYGLDSGVNFVSWMIFALPGSVICLILAWMWLQTLFLGKTSLLCCISRSVEGQDRIKTVIREEYVKLGKMKFAEAAVLVHFVTLVLLWLTRNFPYVGGWGQFLPQGYVGDSAAAIFIVICLFVVPSERPRVFCWRKSGAPSEQVPPLLTWKTVQSKFPWGVLLLIGGGFALADACEKSGLSRWIGNELAVFSSLQPSVMNLVLMLLIAAATEVTSNTATASLLLPIMGNLALSLNLNPLFLMFPCAIATSFAFMLPVATPPNAIVFANGYIKVSDMATAGLLMNIICVLVLSLAVNTWGDAYFDLFNLPQGFPTNGTVQA